jgi:hypothetical protein
MRCFVYLALNVALGALAGLGIADAVAAHSVSAFYFVGSGVIGGILAGAAGCL